jgi:hypothetical protein
MFMRWPNNHSAQLASSLTKLADAVQFYYGHQYDRALAYLRRLAVNGFWTDSELQTLPFHTQLLQPQGMGAPRYVLHQTVLNALAPAIPLRAIFTGNRRQ